MSAGSLYPAGAYFSILFIYLKTYSDDMRRKPVKFSNPLRILLLTNGLVLVAGAMLGPIYALFVGTIGGDLLDASLTGGMFALAGGLTTLFVGKFVDRFEEDELIVAFGYMMMGIGFLLYTFVDSLMFLLVVQIIIGFSEAIYSPAFDATFTKHTSAKRVGIQWGTWEAMNYFTAAIGAAVGGIIATLWGFDVIFIGMALLCFASGFFIWRLPRHIL